MRPRHVATSLLAAAGAAGAQDAALSDPAAFTLGQIVVTGTRQPGIAIGGQSIGAEAIYTFDRNSLDQAASLIPGVSASNTGGSRNERLLFVRGFDRFQVPLSIDGIRVYLPADNRLDYGRFLTPDIAEVQVAKGLASVLDGPGAMGGAVNLVTRRPSKEIEAEVRGQLSLDRDLDYAGYNVFALLGTRQEKWYAQASYARNVTDHWDLPGDFTPTANENGGERDLSGTRDWRVNAKIGFTPNATDEYALSYTRQEGRKNAPIETTVPLPAQRYWTWPYWNIDSIYLLTTTALGDRATLRTRAYRNTFDNLLRSFDTRAQNTQTLPRAFNSYYEDEAWGGSAQLDVALTPANTLKIAAFYRSDKHVEFQQVFPSQFTEPRQVNREETWSIAAEDSFALSPELSLVAGISYDWRDLRRAEEYGTPPGGGAARIFSYPLRNGSALNGQGKLQWTPEEGTRVWGGVSSRARFPTIFERFSSRFGGATSNPDLDAERAINYEAGAARTFGPLTAEGTVFYSRLKKTIVAFPLIFQGQPVTQSRNLGSGDYYGGELALSARVAPGFLLGGNYTYLKRELDDPTNAAFRPVGVPTHKAFAYAEWSPLAGLRVVPSVEIVSDRWIVNTAGTRYFRGGSYTLANARIDYAVAEGVEVGAGVRNAFDDLYSLAEGFPEPGRSFFLSARIRY